MFITVTKALLEGFSTTLFLFGVTLLLSLPIGLGISFFAMSKYPLLRYPTRFLIWVIRGTPLMLQLIVIYYGPGIFLKANIWGSGDQGRMVAAIFAFVINYSFYFAEIFRGGIQSIPKGQYEAGEVLGLSKKQIFTHIILLQVIKNILPPISNEVITLVKDTSLARIIAVYEIIWSGQSFIKTAGIVWPLFYTGAFYLLFSGLLEIGFQYLERKLAYFR